MLTDNKATKTKQPMFPLNSPSHRTMTKGLGSEVHQGPKTHTLIMFHKHTVGQPIKSLQHLQSPATKTKVRLYRGQLPTMQLHHEGNTRM